MTDADSLGMTPVVDAAPAKRPFVFISHDSRDAPLAEAFAKLLKSVSAGMITTFYSSDQSPGKGIDFGEEWYARLMERLDVTSDVVCLFTERSLERPWILFEAGVAKGKLNTPVVGVALGVPLKRVSSGPFYQFQNMEDGESDLKKLLMQFAGRVKGLELDEGVVRDQIAAFKESAREILDASRTGDPDAGPEDQNESSVAKLIEEMKALPGRVAERIVEGSEQRRRPLRSRLHPSVLHELAQVSRFSGDDSVSILMAASLVREDFPWLYDASMDVYRAAKSGDDESVHIELDRLRELVEVSRRMARFSESGADELDVEMFLREIPEFMDYVIHQRSPRGRSPKPRRRTASEGKTKPPHES